MAVVLGAVEGAQATRSDRAEGAEDTLRVCADPNNLPFSNLRGECFENALAEMVAGELGKTVAYTWWAQRRGFIRNTLNAGACDVIMGVPPLDMIATTRLITSPPTYESTYVFVTRRDCELRFSSIQAPELKTLRVGLHLMGDNGANTPPAHALGAQHIVDNLVGYMIYGDYREDSPPARLIEAVERGEVGCRGGVGVARRLFREALARSAQDRADHRCGGLPAAPLPVPIAMGVRKDDAALKRQLDEIVVRRRDDIRALLQRSGVPLVENGKEVLMAAEG